MIPKKPAHQASAPVRAPQVQAPVAQAAAPVAKEGTFERTPGKQPDFILKYKTKDGQYTRVVGLYKQEARNGGEEYLKGYDKQEGVTWVAMPNTYSKKEE